MNKEEFLAVLQDILQRDDAVNQDDRLADYAEWDSLSKMSVLAYYNRNFGVNINLNDLKTVQSVTELIRLAGDNIQ